jgi:hypothetical protein
MQRRLRRRFWLESVLGSATGCLTVVTLSWHNWIEDILGTDPDQGNGSAEWLVVAALVIATIILTIVARLEWRRARLPSHEGGRL